MMAVVTGVIGIAMLLGYLGILIWWIKAPPLIIIVAVVVLLMLYDFVQTVREGGNGADS